MTPAVMTLAILGAAVVAFVSNRVAIELVAIGVAIALWATGVVTVQEAVAGFGDPTVVFIATLFVISFALDATGVTAWAGQRVLDRVGERRVPLLVAICLLVAVLTAAISVNGSVAALAPLVVLVGVRAGHSPSKLLLPMAFAAHAGSLLTLVGSPVNIIVSDAAVTAGGRPFGFFEFALVGVPLLAGTIALGTWLSPGLLPVREPASLPLDPGGLSRSLRRQYDLPADQSLLGKREGVIEVVVPPRSPLIGQHLFPGMTTPKAGLVVLAVQRGGEDLSGPDATLQSGDTLLLAGTWDQLQEKVVGPDVLVMQDPQDLRSSIPLSLGARRALVVLAATVLLLASGLVPPVMVGLLAVSALVILRVLSPTQVYRAVSWTTVVLIAGMIPLATAFTQTGAADMVADLLLSATGGLPLYAALAAICVVTMILGQLISNVATVLVMVPVALAVATSTGSSVMPFMMALSVAGAAAFLTPIATPANMMVMEPGGYRFGDYWRFGLPMLLWFLAVAVLLVPVIWPF